MLLDVFSWLKSSPFECIILSFDNNQKLDGVKSGEQEAWRTSVLLDEKWLDDVDGID